MGASLDFWNDLIESRSGATDDDVDLVLVLLCRDWLLTLLRLVISPRTDDAVCVRACV